MSQHFEKRWGLKLKAAMERVAPWDRHHLPYLPENPTEAEVVDYLEIAQPLIRKGRWWYFLMGAVRACEAVWGHKLGRVVVLMSFVVAYQIYVHLYLQSLDYRIQTVGKEDFMEDLLPSEFLFPWSKGDEVEELVERHERAVDLMLKYGGDIDYPYPEIALNEEVYRWNQKHGALFELSYVRAGSFQMGCTAEQIDCAEDEQPVHEVQLSHSFFMMKSEVTQKLWKKMMGTNPSYYSSCGDDCPVEEVSWLDAIEFSNRLNEQLGYEVCYKIEGKEVVWSKGYKCKGWRLPTEAEWEYAARGGEVHLYSGSDDLGEVAWYKDNSREKTHPVCRKKLNGYDLCDMNGNVWEWVWDRYGAYEPSRQVDPVGHKDGGDRIRRGGGFNKNADFSHVSLRYQHNPSSAFNYLGFRLCRSAF